MRRFFITGCNTGIGFETMKQVLAADVNNMVYCACRSRDKAETAIASVKKELGISDDARVKFFPIDLASFQSVKRCADDLKKELGTQNNKLYALVCNAGRAGPSSALTEDGFQLTWQANYLSHFLLIHLLMDSIDKLVVSVSSRGHFFAEGIPSDETVQKLESFTGKPEYNQSKLAQLLMTRSLRQRFTPSRGLVFVGLHPGVIASDIWRSVPWPIRPILTYFMSSTAEGATATMWCLNNPDLIKDTVYLDSDAKPKEALKIVYDDDECERLYQRSLEDVKGYL